MRNVVAVIALLSLAGCKHCSSDTPAADSGVSVPPPSASTAAIADAAPDVATTSAPKPLALVARGHGLASPTARIDVLGSRVWISTGDLEATADGDAALVPGADFAKGTGFVPKKHSLLVVGQWPDLFAFRRNDEPCAVIDEPKVFTGRAGIWTPGPAVRDIAAPPIGFVAWQGSALLVEGQFSNCGWAMSGIGPLEAPGPGTSITRLASDGKVDQPTLDLDPNFVAWDVSSGGDALSLLGTMSGRSGAQPRNIVVMRRTGSGPFKPTVLVKGTGPSMSSLRAHVRELGTVALVWPPPARDDGTPFAGATMGGDEIAWKGHAATLFVIEGDTHRELKFRAKAEPECRLVDAAIASGVIHAIVACPGADPRFVRFDEGGTPQPVALALPEAGSSCRAKSLSVRLPDELWILAECNKGEGAVFRSTSRLDPVVDLPRP